MSNRNTNVPETDFWQQGFSYPIGRGCQINPSAESAAPGGAETCRMPRSARNGGHREDPVKTLDFGGGISGPKRYHRPWRSGHSPPSVQGSIVESRMSPSIDPAFFLDERVCAATIGAVISYAHKPTCRPIVPPWRACWQPRGRSGGGEEPPATMCLVLAEKQGLLNCVANRVLQSPAE